MATDFIDRIALRAQVTGIERAAERSWLIRIAGPALDGLDWIPGQHVRVLTNGPLHHLTDLLRNSLRTYSIWSHTGDQIELCVYEHAEDGPGSRWAATLKAGDEVSFRRPEGRLVLDPAAPYHLFVGEDTATVAFGAMLRALPAEASAYAVLEAAGPAARLPLPGKAEVTWVDREDAPAANSTLLIEALRAANLPQAPGIAYVAGEARTCQAARTHLVRDRGWPRRSVIVKPFWAPGRRGME